MRLRSGSRSLVAVGTILLPALWIVVKASFSVPDRFLPGPWAVVRSIVDIYPPIWIHSAWTLSRIIVGSIAGLAAGVALGILLVRSTTARLLLLPSVQALRAVPPIATVPFFLLWFGFSELGRYLLIVLGIAFNLGVACLQILSEHAERHRVMFRGFEIDPTKLTTTYSLPRIAEALLPTVRFSVAMAIGLVVVSELLGAQLGLGYLIQTARSTFSMHVVFLATMLLGIMSVLIDRCLVSFWRRLTFWR